jgi:hypothetical protein
MDMSQSPFGSLALGELASYSGLRKTNELESAADTDHRVPVTRRVVRCHLRSDR